MKIKEFDTVILNQNLPKFHLKKGDLGTVVMIHKNGEAFEVEFITLNGKTVAVETLEASTIRPAAPDEIAHVRKSQSFSSRKGTLKTYKPYKSSAPLRSSGKFSGTVKRNKSTSR